MRTSKRDRNFPTRKPIQGQKVSTLETDLTAFLGVLCVEWGFCLPPADARRLANLDRVTAEEFAKQLLEAEGMNADSSPWFQRIAKRFSKLFGNEVVASSYQSRI